MVKVNTAFHKSNVFANSLHKKNTLGKGIRINFREMLTDGLFVEDFAHQSGTQWIALLVEELPAPEFQSEKLVDLIGIILDAPAIVIDDFLY
jgi:hypothetical protein